MYKLVNPVQHYSWGSTSSIPEILGVDNFEKKPFAELWMGAHSSAVSKVYINDKIIPLNELIAQNPNTVLGENRKTLPFLLKILAATKPLSIQLHPNKDEAIKGFNRENKQKIPIDAPFRNYKDNNHKPEILCALSKFTALKGFRSPKDIYDNFSQIESDVIRGQLNNFKSELNPSGLESFFSYILKLSEDKKNSLIRLAESNFINSNKLHHQWLYRLIREYAYDIGVLAPFFLNIILLEPNEAIFIKSGELHAYLNGTGIELMANSDNVLRGGLTQKHIDKDELLSLTNFSQASTKLVKIKKMSNGEHTYITNSNDFELSTIDLKKGIIFQSQYENKAKILLCLKGNIKITDKARKINLDCSQGESIFIPANISNFVLEGEGAIFKAC